MATLVCPNGHFTDDPDTLRCKEPGCEEWVRQLAPAKKGSASAPLESRPSGDHETSVPTAAASAHGSGPTGMSTGVHLLLVGLSLAALAGLLIGFDSADGEPGIGAVCGWIAASVASTLWFIGCIAVGVRIGQRDALR